MIRFNEHKFTGFLTCPIQILLEHVINRRNEREKRAKVNYLCFESINFGNHRKQRIGVEQTYPFSRMDVSINDSNEMVRRHFLRCVNGRLH